MTEETKKEIIMPEGEEENLPLKQALEEIEAEKEGRQPEDYLNPEKEEDKESETETEEKPEEEAEEAPAEEKEAEEEESEEEESEDKPEDTEEKPEEEVETKEITDEEVTGYAEKYGMTYPEAKEDLEKTNEIIKQYKNDPAEMAKAMRNKDREYHKLRNENEKLAKDQEPVFKRVPDEEYRREARIYNQNNPQVVEKFKESFPGKAETMTDEAIIEEIAEYQLNLYRKKATDKEAEIKSSASKRRDELLSAIPESDRKFIPEVKTFLLETDDAIIVNPNFKLDDALRWSKGKSYDADVKAATELGKKQGKEKPVIIGTKTSKGSGSKPKNPVKTNGALLNAAQKDMANQMYGHFDGCATEEDCFRMFRETYEEELKNDPNFVRFTIKK